MSWSTEDARENLRLTVDQLVSALGSGEAVAGGNTVGYRWIFEPSSIELRVWPPDMQSWPATNLSHEREPRLKTACFIAIHTGFRPRASAGDKALIESFTPLGRILDEQTMTGASSNQPASEYNLEFIRLPEEGFEHCRGLIGCSTDKSALIYFGCELYVVPMKDVLEFRVAPTLPAKGGGGSELSVKCRCDYPGLKTKTLTICCAGGADDLNQLAAAVARATGKPYVLSPYHYDA